MVAQDERHKDVLLALGRPVPKKWLAQERKDALAAEGAVDFNTNAVLESEDCDELAEIAFEDELTMVYGDYEEDTADVAQARTYKLRTTSKALDAEVEAFTKRRTAVLCRHRFGAAVQATTVER